MQKERHTQVNVRMPDSLKERLTVSAEASGRSVTAEILWRLEASYAHQEPMDARLLRQSALVQDQQIALVKASETLRKLMADIDELRARAEMRKG